MFLDKYNFQWIKSVTFQLYIIQLHFDISKLTEIPINYYKSDTHKHTNSFYDKLFG